MDGDPELVSVDVVGVRTHLADDEIVVLLLDPVSELVVPILIGPAEAGAIAAAQSGTVPPRPMTHDLLRDVVRALGANVVRVEITRLEAGVFYAELVLAGGLRIDSRASDAIALALRFGCPVLCSAEVVAVAGIETRASEESAGADVEMEEFRQFLETVSADDFETDEDDDDGDAPRERPSGDDPHQGPDRPAL